MSRNVGKYQLENKELIIGRSDEEQEKKERKKRTRYRWLISH